MSNNWYLNNPWIHADRQLGQSNSEWVKQFDVSHLKPLIICRGPIRKEAMDVFDEMGIDFTTNGLMVTPVGAFIVLGFIIWVQRTKTGYVEH